MELNKIFNDIEKCERGCSEYYRVTDFIRRLGEIENITIDEDVVLTPFYLLPNSTYELYDYAVYFLNVKQSQKEEYILKKTGKKSLEEIDSEIVDKLGMCYIEIMNGNSMEVMVKFKKYLAHLLNNPKVEERIPENLRPFDRRQLYFEVIKL